MKYTKEYLTELVNKSKCMWEVVENAGMSKNEGNYTYLWRRIRKYDINTLHFEDQRKGQNRRGKDLSEYLIKGSEISINGNSIKRKLYKAGLKERKCERCGQGEIWLGDKISLILDHIDGDRNNNLLENLRILCPNCNATLPTHGGKNRKNTFDKNNTAKKIKQEFINDFKKLIDNSNIDFTKRGWRVELSKLLGSSEQNAERKLKILLPEIYKIRWVQEKYWERKNQKQEVNNK